MCISYINCINKFHIQIYIYLINFNRALDSCYKSFQEKMHSDRPISPSALLKPLLSVQVRCANLLDRLNARENLFANLSQPLELPRQSPPGVPLRRMCCAGCSHQCRAASRAVHTVVQAALSSWVTIENLQR